ncbi:MAG: response regulator, partial [Myxococcota bacterium]
MEATDRVRYLEYRQHVERERLPSALRGAILIFALLQTLVFIPADWVLHGEHFGLFLAARMALNGALFAIYFGTVVRWPVLSSALVCGLGTLLFLTMVEQTGGVASGYYVGMILLVIGMGVLTPQSAKHSALISGMMLAAYFALPLYSGHPFDARMFVENVFFLAAACAEACWASAHMDRMGFVDYKQKRELEEARDALAELDHAKSRFSSNVHHELRTPLTLILAPLDAIRAGEFGEVPDSVQGTLATMHANGQRLHKMINNLLDLTKLESHQFKLLRRKTQLFGLVTELVAGAQPLADRKQVSLCMQGLDDLPELYVDPEAIEKVLVNLIGNALKFTSAGDQIVISATERKGGVELRVRDSGAGIPPEKIPTIFDRFAQVDASPTRRHEGTGIGLALVREMVELHGGEVSASSDGLGCGTTICVFLPKGEADAMPEEMVLADDRGEVHGLGEGVQALSAELHLDNRVLEENPLGEIARHVDRWKDDLEPNESGAACPGAGSDAAEILIAEDNPDMRALLARLVGREFRVRVARNGREALSAVHERAPDLLLLDVMMPEMSGTELCRAIKEDPATRAIPVVLVTSKAEREMKIEGLELGADDYVTKPFHPRELMARVRSLVRVAELQKQLRHRNQDLEKALSDVKHAEVQLVQSERLAAVGELAAGIAHEVNNPVNFALNAVRAMKVTVAELRQLAGEMTEMDPSDPEDLVRKVEVFQRRSEGESACELAEALCELSTIVGDGLKRTSSLVGDLREFARPGHRSQLQEGVDLEVGLRSTIKLCSHAIENVHAKIELQ